MISSNYLLLSTGQTPPRRAQGTPPRGQGSPATRVRSSGVARSRILEVDDDIVSDDDVKEQIGNPFEDHSRLASYLPVPMSRGYHEAMNRNYDPVSNMILTSKVERFECIRYMVQNALTIEDIEVKWIDEKTLRLCLLWPVVFQLASLMCSMYCHPSGAEVFSKDHAMITSMENSNIAWASGADG